MPNRRQSIHDFYRSVPGGGLLLEKAAASGSDYDFRGNAIVDAIVTRTDLNGYSAWARDRTASQRAAQLDTFFSSVVPEIERAGGVFFRDEGDCIVALFSDYFQRGSSHEKAERYCLTASSRTYGLAQLTAKSVIACGSVAIFQKKHEVLSGDWSAEGEPFVRAARLEAAIASTKQVAFYKDDYDRHFLATNVGGPGSIVAWNIERESCQVAGLGAAGGWSDIVRLEYLL
jgi:hypothetical protein